MGLRMVYCEEQPYYSNSYRYFKDILCGLDSEYFNWMLGDSHTALVSMLGSFQPPQYRWAFNTDEDATAFKLRWG